MPCALTPACRVDVRGVGIHPEVMAVRVAIEVEPQTVATDLKKDMTGVISQNKVVSVWTLTGH